LKVTGWKGHSNPGTEVPSTQKGRAGRREIVPNIYGKLPSNPPADTINEL